MTFHVLLALAVNTIAWQDLPVPAQRLWTETENGSFEGTLDEIRKRNAARLREGEIDHLIFYMLQSGDLVPGDPDNRIKQLLAALKHPSDERQRYLATLLPASGQEAFLRSELSRVSAWIREKEVGCRSAPSPQACVAALYTTRGHSSDTNPASMIAVNAAFKLLGRSDFKRILLIGPGSDFAPRIGNRGGPAQVYQPKLLRDLLPGEITIDCVDLNPRVLKSAASECQSTDRLDVAVERLDRTYDAIIATNVLLYLNQTELLLAMANVRAMLRPSGVFIHNDGRFEANLFGKAVGLPVLHFGSVDLDTSRRPPVVDRFVIHSPAEPKL